LIEYRIEALPEQPGYIRLTSISQTEILNSTTSAKEYEFSFEVQETSYEEVCQSEISHVSLTAGSEDVFNYSSSELSKNVTRTNGFLRFSKRKTIPKHPHPVYRFTIEAVECFLDNYDAPFFVKEPVLKTRLRVFYPKDRLRVDAYLSFDGAELHKSELLEATEWTLATPIMPGQGIFVRWATISTPQKTPDTKALAESAG
jgi:hypothetical protein